MSAALTIAIAGNPNCGKSALFNTLTGIRQKTGNWPGVTVERKAGYTRIDDRDVTVVDLPGIYSFDAASLDEVVTRDYLLSREADLVVNVVDAATLRAAQANPAEYRSLVVRVAATVTDADSAELEGGGRRGDRVSGGREEDKHSDDRKPDRMRDHDEVDGRKREQ